MKTNQTIFMIDQDSQGQIRLWNQIPNNIQLLGNVIMFKTAISRHLSLNNF